MGWSQRVNDDRKRVLELPGPLRGSSPSCRATRSTWPPSGARARWSAGRTTASSRPTSSRRSRASAGRRTRASTTSSTGARTSVLANQEENTRGDLEALAQRGVRVYVAFPKRVADGLAHLAKLARIFGVERDAAVRALLRRGYDEQRARRAGAREGAGAADVLPDLDGSAHDDPRRHVHQRHARPLRRVRTSSPTGERRYPLAADLGRAAPLPPEKVAERDVRYPRVTLEEVIARAPELVAPARTSRTRSRRPTRRCSARSRFPRPRAAPSSDGRQGPMLVRRAQHRGHRSRPRPRRAVHVVDRSVVQCPHFFAASGMASAQWGHGFVVTDGL